MENKFEINTLVWAKLNGYPWWPAIIKTKINEEKCEVEYFGDFSRSYLSVTKLKPFLETSSAPDRKPTKLYSAYETALKVLKKETTIECEKQKLENLFCNKSVKSKSKEASGSIKKQSIKSNLTMKRQKSGPSAVYRNRISKINKKTETLQSSNKDEVFFDDSNKSENNESMKFEQQEEQERPKNASQEKLISITSKDFSEEPKNLESEKLKHLETKIKHLNSLLEELQLNFDEINTIFNEIQTEILSDEIVIQKMYNTEIGPKLTSLRLKANAMQLSNENSRIFSENITNLSKAIRKKLFVSFFKTKEADQKVIFSSNEMENIINVRRPAVSSDRISQSKKLEQQTQNKLDGRTKKNKEMHSDLLKTKRVCKKIAKQIYSKSRQLKMKKKDCERISEFVEVNIRGRMKNSEDYERGILEIDEKIKNGYDDFIQRIKDKNGVKSSKVKMQKIQSFLLENEIN